MRIGTITLIMLFSIGSCSIRESERMPFRLKRLESRAASYENRKAEKGRGGMSKNGIKGSPAIKDFRKGSTDTLLFQDGPGMIRHFWCTMKPADQEVIRNVIIRMYWENHPVPSVEVPVSDFFGLAHGAIAPLYSDLIAVQPSQGYNCFIPMPFGENALITVTNESDTDLDWFFYLVDFTLGDRVTIHDGRFHASFRRENPTELGRDFTIMETRQARGIFLGCVIGVRSLSPGWFGEGEVKMYIDGDKEYPTICGTGLEDYIGAAWGIREHTTFTQGAPLVDQEKGYASFYRFHINDPVYFQNEIRVTVQQMGMALKSEALAEYGDKLIFSYIDHPRRNPEAGYHLRSDDVCATAYWYQYPLISCRDPLPDKVSRTDHLYKEKRSFQPLADTGM
jgi:hypothetical protein